MSKQCGIEYNAKSTHCQSCIAEYNFKELSVTAIKVCPLISENLERQELLNIATFDIEANNWINAFALGFYDGKKYRVFEGDDCVEKFTDFLFKDNYSKYKIFSHYGGIYDHTFIIDDMEDRGLLQKLQIIVSSQAVIKMMLRYSRQQRYHFCDSGQILPRSLKFLTEKFAVDHQKLDVDAGDFSKYTMEEQLSYLKNDTIGLHEVLMKFFLRTHDKFGIYPSLTLASTGMKLFKTMCKYKIETVNSFPLDDFLRRGYRGGRVEVFKIYIDSLIGETWIYVDFNSLYPDRMRNGGIYPIGKYNYITSNWHEYYDRGMRGIGRFKIKSPNLYIPFLPVKINKKLYFANGEFEDYYTFTEIVYAESLGYECEFIEGYLARGVPDLFNLFVDTIFDDRIKAKLAGNQIDDFIDKLYMNACSGKFGERKEINEIVFNITREDIAEHEVEVYNEDPLIYLKKIKQHREYHNVGIIAEVTALSRIKLYQQMKEIIDAGYEVAYCDTDSIVTNYPASRLPIDDLKLGYLKKEFDITGRGLFLAPKFYMFEYKGMSDEKSHVKFVHKGMKNMHFTFDELLGYYKSGDYSKIISTYTAINKFKGALKRVNVDQRKSPFLSSVTVSKHFRSIYDKRNINGVNTTPRKIIDGVLI